MFCPNCGNKNSETAMFCTNCGSPLKKPQSAESSQEASAPSKKKRLNPLFIILPIVIAFFVLILVIAAVVIGFVLSSDNSASDGPAEIATELSTVAMPKYIEVSTYEVIKSDNTWSGADRSAAFYGGSLVSINDEEEFKKVCALADDAGIKVFWVGATRSYNDSWEDTLWLDGSEMNYANWLRGEPTYVSEYDEDEYYLMVFKVGSDWYFNDAVHDVSSYYTGKMGYIIEYTEYIEVE